MNGRVNGLPGLWSALAAQSRVVRALILREMQVRYGRDNIGILWIVLEPMLFAVSVTAIHSLSGYGHFGEGQQVFPFTVIGYCLFIIFRNIFNRSEGMLRDAQTLLYHRTVTPFDIILAKAAVDAIGCVCALVILISLGISLGLAHVPARPLYIIMATGLIFWLTFGLALVISAYTFDGHFIGRLVHPFSYAMVPLSGAFVTMSFLPEWAREYMAWNPMMGMFEMARFGQFRASTPEYIHFEYSLAACAGFTCWGLLAMRDLRQRIHV